MQSWKHSESTLSQRQMFLSSLVILKVLATFCENFCAVVSYIASDKVVEQIRSDIMRSRVRRKTLLRHLLLDAFIVHNSVLAALTAEARHLMHINANAMIYLYTNHNSRGR